MLSVIKCAVQWLDPVTHEPTPDHNDAVVMIQCADYEIPNNDAFWQVSEFIPCCLQHLQRMPTDGRWQIVDMARNYRMVATKREV